MIVSKYYLNSSKVNKDYNIIVISDYHNCKYDKILEILPSKVDIILMPGDFVVRYTKGKRDKVLSFLSKLCQVAPVYCSLGNHDYKTMSKKAFINMISSSGATPLLNSSSKFNELLISGWYYEKNEGVLNRLQSEHDYNILLSHKPEWYRKYIKNKKFDLVVSGHAHGGQIRILGQGLYAPGQGIFPKLTHGIIDNKLIISTGVSNPVHMPRFGNPKEIILINLKRAEQ